MAKKDRLLSPLIDNALDFFEHAVTDLESHPHLSLVHFCSAVELVLKARLMMEHWSLVLQDPRRADRAKFESGDFRSVSISESVDRLGVIVGSSLSAEQRRAFENLQSHRNRLVHFFHPAYKEGGGKAVQEIVAEEARGWFYLHELMTRKWKKQFAKHASRIAVIDRKLRDQHVYLQLTFDQLRDRLDSIAASGGRLEACIVCGFRAMEERDEPPLVVTGRCHVCDFRDARAHFPCPKCEKPLTILEFDEVSCEVCEILFSVDLFEEVFHPDLNSKAGMLGPRPAFCSVCEHVPQSAMCVDDDEGVYLCFNCFTHSTSSECDFCGERITGSSEDTYAFGCVMCEGKLGSDRS